MSPGFGAGFDHGATDPTVDRAVIETQLATATALRTRLNERGGAILGDEVGAGKTFVSFALITDLLLREPQRGAVIFVPSQLLAHKWAVQFKDYLIASVTDSTLGRKLAGRIHMMNRTLDQAKTDAIVITTHSVYSYRTSEGDQAACLQAALGLFPEGRGRHRRSVLKAFGLSHHGGDAWPTWALPGALNKTTLEPFVPLLRRYGDGERGLQEPMRAAVQDVRRLVGRLALPDAGLVIIDEAHNLKSTKSAIYRSLLGVLDQRFDALLFLTATPFQLGRSELLTIVDFFTASRLAGRDPCAFAVQRQALSDAMDGHVDALDRFGAAWRDLSTEQVTQVRAVIAGDAAAATDALTAEVATTFDAACSAKATLENAMRPFVVRSVRVRHHRETGCIDERFITQQARVPLALVDRLLVEILSERRTFVSSALISACSSWPALLGAAIMSDDGRAPSATRGALRELSDGGLLGTHPKVEQTVAAVIDAVGRGEKTLVFVEREQTGQELLGRIVAEMGKLQDQDLSSAQAQLQALQDKTRFGWPSLRENYISTILPRILGRPAARADIERIWADPAVKQLWARCDTDGEKHEYAIEKRFWEHALFTAATAGGLGRKFGLPGTVAACVDRILEPDYVLNGLDLVSGFSNTRLLVPPSPVRAEYRDPNERFARALVKFRSPWSICTDRLDILDPDRRAAVVDVAAGAIATSHFRAEIAAVDTRGNPTRHFQEIDRLLLDDNGPWPTRFRAIAELAADAVRTSDDELAGSRLAALLAALAGQKADRRVVFVHGKTHGETRQRAVDAFNTPLYPEVLIATPILAEGLDLHRFCRRVIHHDLPWNPAKLEQRTGRVDRVGSLAERLRRANRSTLVPIEVSLPFVPGTYDEFVHDRVLARRREFRCLLGNRPEWRGDGELGESEQGQPIAEELVTALQVNLAPSR